MVNLGYEEVNIGENKLESNKGRMSSLELAVSKPRIVGFSQDYMHVSYCCEHAYKMDLL